MTFARLVEGLMPHLIVVPILLPMVTAAVMLLLGDTRRPLKAIINVLSCVLGVGVAIALISGTTPMPISTFAPAVKNRFILPLIISATQREMILRPNEEC